MRLGWGVAGCSRRVRLGVWGVGFGWDGGGLWKGMGVWLWGCCWLVGREWLGLGCGDWVWMGCNRVVSEVGQGWGVMVA